MIYQPTKQDKENIALISGMTMEVRTIEGIQAAVPEGWHELVFKLIDRLLDLGWDGYLVQIQILSGMLKFYIYGNTDEIQTAIRLAENESAETCMDCGALNAQQWGTGWLVTLCEPCYRTVWAAPKSADSVA